MGEERWGEGRSRTGGGGAHFTVAAAGVGMIVTLMSEAKAAGIREVA